MIAMPERIRNGAAPERCANKSSSGIASASRQKPAATGPTSASRTIHGPSARKMFATIKAAKA